MYSFVSVGNSGDTVPVFSLADGPHYRAFPRSAPAFFHLGEAEFLWAEVDMKSE